MIFRCLHSYAPRRPRSWQLPLRSERHHPAPAILHVFLSKLWYFRDFLDLECTAAKYFKVAVVLHDLTYEPSFTFSVMLLPFKGIHRFRSSGSVSGGVHFGV